MAFQNVKKFHFNPVTPCHTHRHTHEILHTRFTKRQTAKKQKRTNINDRSKSVRVMNFNCEKNFFFHLYNLTIDYNSFRGGKGENFLVDNNYYSNLTWLLTTNFKEKWDYIFSPTILFVYEEWMNDDKFLMKMTWMKMFPSSSLY